MSPVSSSKGQLVDHWTLNPRAGYEPCLEQQRSVGRSLDSESEGQSMSPVWSSKGQLVDHWTLNPRAGYEPCLEQQRSVGRSLNSESKGHE